MTEPFYVVAGRVIYLNVLDLSSCTWEMVIIMHHNLTCLNAKVFVNIEFRCSLENYFTLIKHSNWAKKTHELDQRMQRNKSLIKDNPIPPIINLDS